MRKESIPAAGKSGGAALKIVVAAHKAYAFPDDPAYLPVQVGRELHSELAGLTGDDTGDNISAENPGFCELTALYWAWKNLSADALGLAHYRRYLAGGIWGRRHILSGSELEKLLECAPVILPKKRHYFIETNYSQYVHAHHAADLTVLRAVVAAKFPAYLESFDQVMRRTSGHRFNMLVMRRDILDGYCRWLFEILFAVATELDLTGYSDYDRRVFGFLGERLLDVYLEHERLPYVECPVLHLESQHWPRKIPAFLLRKWRGR